MNVGNQIKKHLVNLPGWRTNRKLVLIESDDWGSIRMPSKEAYNRLLSHGIRVDQCHYLRNDSLETEDDLSLLFDVLSSVKDKNGNNAVITANTLVANPDFHKIKADNFEKYSFELITESYKKTSGAERSFELIKEAQNRGLFQMQSHGREHLNINRWMYYLQNDFPETEFAFEQGVYGISTTVSSENRKSFLPAFDFESIEDMESVNTIAAEGLRLFEQLFGFKSESFIASNYVWGESLEEVLTNNGVKFLQGLHRHRYRSLNQSVKTRFRYIGKVNQSGLIDLVRNATFEPSENPNKDWISTCLKEIETAFLWKKPAVISSHRVNFMGSLNVNNRDKNLALFKNLLKEIVKRWSDVEFIGSADLGNIILESRK